MEKGDPSVGMGGDATAFPEVAAPAHDVNAQARQMVHEIAKQIPRWQANFNSLGLLEKDLDLLAQYLDGAGLREPRQQAL